jgi:hypothetical protein
MTPTVNRVATTLEMLAQFSALTDDAEVRDAIGLIRFKLWDWYEELEAE